MVTVPNRFSQVAPAKRATISSGRAERGGVPLAGVREVEEPVAHDPADEGDLVAGTGQSSQHVDDALRQDGVHQLGGHDTHTRTAPSTSPAMSIGPAPVRR